MTEKYFLRNCRCREKMPSLDTPIHEIDTDAVNTALTCIDTEKEDLGITSDIIPIDCKEFELYKVKEHGLQIKKAFRIRYTCRHCGQDAANIIKLGKPATGFIYEEGVNEGEKVDWSYLQ